MIFFHLVCCCRRVVFECLAGWFLSLSLTVFVRVCVGLICIFFSLFDGFPIHKMPMHTAHTHTEIKYTTNVCPLSGYRCSRSFLRFYLLSLPLFSLKFDPTLEYCCCFFLCWSDIYYYIGNVTLDVTSRASYPVATVIYDLGSVTNLKVFVLSVFLLLL